jgi:hypothetical protein
MTAKTNRPGKAKCTPARTAVAPTDKARHLQVIRDPGKSEDRMLADLVAHGVATNASTAIQFVGAVHRDLSMTEMVESLREQGEAVNRGDLSAAERMLNSQAVALNAMFGELARRAALNMGTHLGATESYMRLALKAQSQSRATVETLAVIKNPPVVFARQANINNGGQQQVNNGSAAPMTGQPSHAPESETEPSKLLEAPNGERLDFGTKGKSSRAHPRVAAVGAIKRPQDRSR